jgi:hypothetical protein
VNFRLLDEVGFKTSGFLRILAGSLVSMIASTSLMAGISHTNGYPRGHLMDLTDLSIRIYYAIGKANSLRESGKLTKAQKKYQKQQFDKAVLRTLEKAATELEAYLKELDELGTSAKRMKV